MHAVVRSIASDDVGIGDFAPGDPACFALNLRIQIGSDGAPGADDFELCVCTPKWLEQTIWAPRWGRHLLIVREYDRSAIETCIRNYAAKCSGDDWDDIAKRLARNLSWEFEDYRE